MAVINLGAAQRRESPLSGLSEGLARGMQIGETARSNRAREKLEESALSSKLADQTLRKREQDLENVRKTHEQFSMVWSGMDAQEQAIFKTSDQYKEIAKMLKSFNSLVPGLVKDNGEIVASRPKDRFTRKLDEQVAKSKLRIAEGQGTAKDVELIKMTSSDKDLLADALADTTKRLKGAEARDPNALIQGVKNFFNKFRRQPEAQTPVQEGLAQPSAVQVTQPQAPVSPLSEGLKGDFLDILPK